MFSKKVMISALATAALVWPAAASARIPDQVPPPPSSIAASAADEYNELRSIGTQDLRSPDTRDEATGYAPVLQESAGDVSSSGGFDAVSGALGAAAGIGLAVAAFFLASTLTGVRQPRRHAARS
jgi:hypothetical protein